MAENLVQMILQGIQAGQRKKQAEGEASREQQRIDNEKLAREQAHQLALKEHDERKTLIDAQIKELAAKIAHQSLATKMAISESFLKGQPVPGVESFPMSSGTNGAAMSPANPQQATSQILTLPKELGGDQLTIPTATQFANQQADLSRIRMQPEVDAKIKESRALQADLLERQRQAKDEDFVRMMMQKTYDDNRQAAKDKAEFEREKYRRAIDLQIAKLKLGEGNLDLKPYAEDAYSGKISADDIKKLPIGQQDKIKILGAVNSANARVLTKEQKDFLEGFPQLINAIPYMDTLIKNQSDTHNGFTGMLSGAANSFNDAITVPDDELTARKSIVGRFLKEKGNMSNKDIERVAGMVPSRFNSKSSNITKRDSYIDELSKVIDTYLSNVPDGQRATIKKNLGLFDLSKFGSQQQQQTNGNSSQPQILNWTPNGLVPGK